MAILLSFYAPKTLFYVFKHIFRINNMKRLPIRAQAPLSQQCPHIKGPLPNIR